MRTSELAQRFEDYQQGRWVDLVRCGLGMVDEHRSTPNTNESEGRFEEGAAGAGVSSPSGVDGSTFLATGREHVERVVTTKTLCSEGMMYPAAKECVYFVLLRVKDVMLRASEMSGGLEK